MATIRERYNNPITKYTSRTRVCLALYGREQSTGPLPRPRTGLASFVAWIVRAYPLGERSKFFHDGGTNGGDSLRCCHKVSCDDLPNHFNFRSACISYCLYPSFTCRIGANEVQMLTTPPCPGTTNVSAMTAGFNLTQKANLSIVTI